jgi:hypothetical protein
MPVSWPALKGQFGTAFTELAGFKSWFLAPDGPLALALSVYPDAKVAVKDNGVVLNPFRIPRYIKRPYADTLSADRQIPAALTPILDCESSRVDLIAPSGWAVSPVVV